ncbi:hypothetical protein VOLCADRAFT_98854 [Volvox carteri f. nagariensis]|uniref:Galactokinase n=1 Tax=Volvox carteri f. nagariensis TaxID=3068 RepID=D8UGG2_VOLCA|nr:uncharacterized protein VOLCADRAFT_98854 [Volvox carteri f. nagariensis]EFJ41193.1 hypothetical protein VOLCADRAFT_98854 [Volvox carteri f. nagariensis]|eukprot:XP_002957761.1 hypothetical protein VOLCADRAFT_98854 [Volvox carteri f. nagariensis]
MRAPLAENSRTKRIMSEVDGKIPSGTALSFKPSPTVPLFSDLADVYPDSTGVAERYKQIATAFELAYGAKPDFYARAPGRVNLIGEHIDYEGYGVLPMAIRQDTVVAIRTAPGTDKLVIGNVEASRYPTAEFGLDPTQEVDVGKHSWANYFLSAYKGVFELLKATRPDSVPEPVGLQVVVHGQVPTGSGLSSSAAIVCSSMLAVLSALGVPPAELDKAAVAEAACKAERYVGVTSGGMDQAISMMGQQGVAMHVEFNPVRGVCVVLPEGGTFVIANSLAVSNKAETAPKRYNLRVVECRLAAVLLAMKLGMSAEDALGKIRTLRDVEPLIAEKYGNADGATCANAVSEHLAEQYGMAEIEDALGGRKLGELFSGEAGSLRALAVAEADKYGFPLRKRAVHVFSEAQRVLDFRTVCEDVSLSPAERLTRLGGLMNDSHGSCADLYGCSCDELDELVAVARGGGALGARLTGAGWGGCTVSLVRDADVEAFLETLKDKYYKSYLTAESNSIPMMCRTPVRLVRQEYEWTTYEKLEPPPKPLSSFS